MGEATAKGGSDAAAGAAAAKPSTSSSSSSSSSAARPLQGPVPAGRKAWELWRTRFVLDARYTPIKVGLIEEKIGRESKKPRRRRMVAVDCLSSSPSSHLFPCSLSFSPHSNFQAIGKGAYGVVASARDEVSGERVAVKKVREEGAQARLFLPLLACSWRASLALLLPPHHPSHRTLLPSTSPRSPAPSTTPPTPGAPSERSRSSGPWARTTTSSPSATCSGRPRPTPGCGGRGGASARPPPPPPPAP